MRQSLRSRADSRLSRSSTTPALANPRSGNGEVDDADRLLDQVNAELSANLARNASDLRKDLKKKAKADKAKVELEQPLTTLEEVWECLCASWGPSPMSIEAVVFLDEFSKCQDIGLGSKLAAVLNPENTAPPDLERRDIAFLCYLALEGGESATWRDQLMARRAEPSFSSLKDKDILQGHVNDCLRLPHFRKLIPAIANSMQLEVAFVLSAFVWVEAQRFELPEKLYEQVFAKNNRIRFLGQSGGESIHDRLFRGEDSGACSAGQFSRNDFFRFCYSLDVVDRDGRSGCTWEYLGKFFDDVAKNMHENVPAYIARRPGKRMADGPAPKAAPKQGRGLRMLEGRTEITVFLESLFKIMPDKRFKSPIDVCIAFLTDNEVDAEEIMKQVLEATNIMDAMDAAGQMSEEKLIELFKERDSDGSGSLELEELASLLRAGNSALTDAQIKTLFELADASGDGNVDFSEFVTFISTGKKQRPSPSPASSQPQRPQELSQREQMKQKFKEQDKNGDGVLDRDELAALLRAGNPSMTDDVIDTLWKHADADGSGTVDFDEFVDFITSGSGSNGSSQAAQPKRQAAQPKRQARPESSAAASSPAGAQPKRAARTESSASASSPAAAQPKRAGRAITVPAALASAGRSGASPAASPRASPRSSAPAAAGGGADDGDAAVLRRVFTAVAGRDKVMDGQEFSRLCQNANLYDRTTFGKTDADVIFAKICPKGQRKLKFKEFQDGLREVAAKKGCSLADIQAAISPLG